MLANIQMHPVFCVRFHRLFYHHVSSVKTLELAQSSRTGGTWKEGKTGQEGFQISQEDMQKGDTRG